MNFDRLHKSGMPNLTEKMHNIYNWRYSPYPYQIYTIGSLCVLWNIVLVELIIEWMNEWMNE